MYDFKNVEGTVASWWEKEKNQIEASLRDEPGKKTFSFLEGPPTANAPPALHHIEMRTFKDAKNRFKYMQGFSVPRKGGWDCHGLPVEVAQEKALGLKSKKEVVALGVGRFVANCRESVFSKIVDWSKTTKEMGYWIDLQNPYVTLTNDYIESVWWSLKQLYDKGLLYEGHKVVPYCPRCETPLSSHEVAQGYKKVSDKTITVKFRLKDADDTFVLAWTTTPWTLPSNVGLAVNPKTTYVKVEKDGQKFILAQERTEHYFPMGKIIGKISGSELVGRKYEALMPFFESAARNSFKIVAGDFVTTLEGTGVVHIAPAFGEDDYNVGKENNLDFLQPVDSSGKFTADVPPLADQFVKKADRQIIEMLEGEGKIIKAESYEHDYPYCWRCDTPLLYYATLSWFVKVTAFRDRLVEKNREINWFPDNIKDGRFGEWLAGAKDWALSRKKFWGTPLPIWKCECGKITCVGSREELIKLTGAADNIDLHKPGIDGLAIKCGACGKTQKRVADVIDCWYDSGSAPFAQLHYPFENKDYFRKRFPYDFIAEAIDQTRGWFYTMHVLSVALFDSVAYKNVVCAGHIVDENNQKMSKSKGNVLDPRKVFDSVGVDAVRLQFCTSAVGEPKRFSEQLVRMQVTPFLNIYWNTYVFTKQFKAASRKEIRIEDKWITSRLNTLVKEYTAHFEKNEFNKCFEKLAVFANDDFSRTYIKLIRERTDEGAAETLKNCLMAVSKLLAPFCPFVTDFVYRDAIESKNIHFTQWPVLEEKKIDPELEGSFALANRIIAEILSKRNEAKIGVRWPLSKAVVYAPATGVLDKLTGLIEKQANVKDVQLEDGEFKVELDTALTIELEKEGFLRELTRKVQDARKNSGLVKENTINLVINSPVDLKGLEKEFAQKVGAKTLKFEKPTGEHFFYSKEKIRDKEFEIAFTAVK
ncbi:isoleucine--tRNA ligase [Candidatus Micrarchaeota archaeon]|nr:isoleucine--tRNA ligase [Candidatus Micrarchaeota archaeon]